MFKRLFSGSRMTRECHVRFCEKFSGFVGRFTHQHFFLFLVVLFCGSLLHCEEKTEASSTKPTQPRDLEKFPLASMFFQDFYKKAEDTRERLFTVAQKISEVSAGESVVPLLKSFERTKEKVDKDYQGDWKKITDVVRGSIAFQNMDDLKKGVAIFSQYLPIVYVKDRFTNPTPSGYKDMLALFRDPANDVIGEIQFHLCHFLKVKNEEHAFYEIEQEIERNAAIERRKLSQDEEDRLYDIRKRGQIIYIQASERTEAKSPCSILKK